MTIGPFKQVWIPVSILLLALPCSQVARDSEPNYFYASNTNLTLLSTPTYTTTDTIPDNDNTCLLNKDFGKNLTPAQIATVNSNYNAPSPFTFGSMIGLNDGGLIFRSFQNSPTNQITQLTTQFRNFHTMDEDFDNSLTNYDQNIKPKDTSPEGTPAHMWYTRYLYNLYRNTHGFTNIAASTEILQYGPMSWKDKIYREDDWSKQGVAGMMNSYENYTKKFIDEMAPANGMGSQLLVSWFQVGNELWDYPIKSDYHSLLLGARNAFLNKYGPKANGGWKMKLVAGAFQAYKENGCGSFLRNVSNCGGALERHDFIGDYLNVPNCDLLRDLDAIDCHPYSFSKGTLSWTHPEDPNSEDWQIRNLAAWRDANKNPATGALMNTRMWSSEYGFDSNPQTGVGEKTHAAYLVRGLLMHSRFHFEKVFYYNAYDKVQPTSVHYTGLYNSSGLWKAGSHPLNNAWPSPLVEHGATPKPAWHSLMDFKNRFGNHVFFKALQEDNELYAYLIALPDGSNPHIVMWSPQATNDNNINSNISINKVLEWANILPGQYRLESNLAQMVATETSAGQTFSAVANDTCGVATITTVRRAPSFLKLVACNTTACTNITNPGSIGVIGNTSGMAPFMPPPLNNASIASGGTGGTIVYQWQTSTNGVDYVNVNGATGHNFSAPNLYQTTWYRRGAKRTTCTEFLFTNAVKFTVTTNTCPTMVALRRISNSNAYCSPGNDFLYELELNNVLQNDQITITGLPSNGLSPSQSSLNGQLFTNNGFNANVQYINANTFKWHVNTANGTTQKLRIAYCWANYPPTSSTSATAACSGFMVTCVPGFDDPGVTEERAENAGFSGAVPASIVAMPNPGRDYFIATYTGPALVAGAYLSVISTTGQLVHEEYTGTLEDQQQWYIDTERWNSGVYFVRLQTPTGTQHLIWVK